MSTRRLDLSDLTWPEYRDLLAEGAVILLPIGATEQHGPHLPLGTDWMLAQEMCRRVAAEIGGIVASPIVYGFKSHPRVGGGDSFPGTTNLTSATFTALVREVLSEFIRHGATRLVALTGHGENDWFVRDACGLASADALASGKDARIIGISWWEPREKDFIPSLYPRKDPVEIEQAIKYAHAAWSETSMGLRVFPDLVRQDLYPPDDVVDFPPYDVFPERPEWQTKSGAHSTVSTATEEAGEALVQHSVDKVIAAARAEFDL